MFEPDPEFQNLAMLYTPAWNGLVEGPTWGAWWIQNSYGPTYCALPFWQEPFVRFIENSHDLWFDQMGDGKTPRPFSNFALGPARRLPVRCRCPGHVHRQAGRRPRVTSTTGAWSSRPPGWSCRPSCCWSAATKRRSGIICPSWSGRPISSRRRRDPKNNLFLAGAAGNLLAPSHAGWKRPDGKYEPSYLAGLSITYIAGLDRLIELEKIAGAAEKVKLYSERRELARKGLPLLTTDEGYFIKSLDPDGTRHGVYGAAKHGYFETVCNHDAICFRVADDAQSEKIYRKIASIPGLRRHDLIVTNYPSLDDMYEPGDRGGLWGFGTWVNGGHWSTCEARMIMAYYRLGKYEDARRSMKKMLDYARRFRMDNPLVDFGNAPYQPGLPINCVYDNWGVPAAMVRGLFEYLYRADGLTIVPHIPAKITRLEQHFPIRFGTRRIYLATTGQGPITGVIVNGQPWKNFTTQQVLLPYDQVPGETVVQIVMGDAKPQTFRPKKQDLSALPGGTRHGYASAEAGRGAHRRDEQSAAANRRRQQRREPLLGADRTARVFSRALSAQGDRRAGCGQDDRRCKLGRRLDAR